MKKALLISLLMALGFAILAAVPFATATPAATVTVGAKVTLENDFFQLDINKTGAGIQRYFLKQQNLAVINSSAYVATGAGRAGWGLRPYEIIPYNSSDWPGELAFATYTATVIATGGDVAQVAFNYVGTTQNPGLNYTKIYTIYATKPYFDIAFVLKNNVITNATLPIRGDGWGDWGKARGLMAEWASLIGTAATNNQTYGFLNATTKKIQIECGQWTYGTNFERTNVLWTGVYNTGTKIFSGVSIKEFNQVHSVNMERDIDAKPVIRIRVEYEPTILGFKGVAAFNWRVYAGSLDPRWLEAGGFNGLAEKYAAADYTTFINYPTTITSLQSQVTTLQGNVSTLQSKVNTLQGNVTSLQSKVDSLTTDLNNATTTSYMYLGGGIIVGLIIGAAVVYVLKRKPK